MALPRALLSRLTNCLVMQRCRPATMPNPVERAMSGEAEEAAALDIGGASPCPTKLDPVICRRFRTGSSCSTAYLAFRGGCGSARLVTRHLHRLVFGGVGEQCSRTLLRLRPFEKTDPRWLLLGEGSLKPAHREAAAPDGWDGRPAPRAGTRAHTWMH